MLLLQRVACGAAIAVMTILATGVSAQLPTERGSDEAQIRQLAQEWQRAWNRHDAQALTGLLADDADFITVLGPKGWLKGRAQFQEAHARMFTTLFDQSQFTTTDVHVRFIAPDLALARVLWATTGDKVRHLRHGERREGIFTWVVRKGEDGWRIIASQNTESLPPLPGQ